MKVDENGFVIKSPYCSLCMELIERIKKGELKGTVMSCHPLDELIDGDLAQYIETKPVRNN